jgi:hypothetical protein
VFSVLVTDCRIIVVGLIPTGPGPLDLDLKNFRPPRPRRESMHRITILANHHGSDTKTPKTYTWSATQMQTFAFFHHCESIACVDCVGVCAPLMEVFEQLAGWPFSLADASRAPEFMYRYLIGWEECICLYIFFAKCGGLYFNY